jgi:hypothetical protein
MPASLEQRLAALRRLDPAARDAIATLRAALGATSGVLVAAAAERVGEHALAPLAPELADAFERLSEQGAKRDPGCRGKQAIARALIALDRWEERVFVAGLRAVQLEGWGDSRDDAAAALRGLCAIAHARLARPDALEVAAELLADRERLARIAAAQAIGDCGRPDGAALLRFKLLAGDAEPEVLSAAAESMLALAPGPSAAFFTRLLADDDGGARAEVAALALGGGRVADACEPLAAWCQVAGAERRRRVGYVALALLRADAANARLLDVIRTGAAADARAAVRALATFREDAELVRAVRAAAAGRRDLPAREVEEMLR